MAAWQGAARNERVRQRARGSRLARRSENGSRRPGGGRLPARGSRLQPLNDDGEGVGVVLKRGAEGGEGAEDVGGGDVLA